MINKISTVIEILLLSPVFTAAVSQATGRTTFEDGQWIWDQLKT